MTSLSDNFASLPEEGKKSGSTTKLFQAISQSIHSCNPQQLFTSGGDVFVLMSTGRIERILLGVDISWFFRLDFVDDWETNPAYCKCEDGHHDGRKVVWRKAQYCSTFLAQIVAANSPFPSDAEAASMGCSVKDGYLRIPPGSRSTFSDKEKCDGPDEELQAQGATCQLFAAHIAVNSTKFTDYEVYVRWTTADGTLLSYQPLTEAWTPTHPQAMNPTCTAAVLEALAGIAGEPPGPTVPIADALYWNNLAGTWKKEIVPGRDVVLLREDDAHADLTTIGALAGAQEDYRRKLAKAMQEGRFSLDDDDGAGGGEQHGEEDPGADEVQEEEETEEDTAAGLHVARMHAGTGAGAKSSSSPARMGSNRKRRREVEEHEAENGEAENEEDGAGTGTGRGAMGSSAGISSSASQPAGSRQHIPGPTRGKGTAHGAGARAAPHTPLQQREEEDAEEVAAEGSFSSTSSALKHAGARGRTVQEAQHAPSSSSSSSSSSSMAAGGVLGASASTSRLPVPHGLPHKQLPVSRGLSQYPSLSSHSSSGGGLKSVISTVEAQLEAAEKAQDMWDSGKPFKRIAAVALAAEVSDMYMEAFSDELRAAVASKSNQR